jgi:nucleoid-associated protein YgaU
VKGQLSTSEAQRTDLTGRVSSLTADLSARTAAAAQASTQAAAAADAQAQTAAAKARADELERSLAKLTAEKAAQASAQAGDAELKKQLDEAATKLEASVRSYSLVENENEKLKTAARSAADETASLREKIAALQQQQAANGTPAPAAAPAAPAPSESDADAKLAMALRSYSLAQNEADDLRAGNDKLSQQNAALSAQLAGLKGSAAAAADAGALRDQLRQTQAQAAALADENSQLKTRLATATPPADLDALRARSADAERRAAGAQAAARNLADENARLKETLASVSQTVGRVVNVAPASAPAPVPAPTVARTDVPTRPSAAPAAAASPQPATQAPQSAAVPAGRTHTIATGDTLAKISRQYYGTADRWPEILAANRDVLRDEKSLVVGRTLRIP